MNSNIFHQLQKLNFLYTTCKMCQKYVAQILNKFQYGRVGGVSKGERANPGIQIVGRLCHYF